VGKILLFVGVPLVVIALVAGAIVAGLSVINRATATGAAQAAAGASVAVNVPNAALEFTPSTDDQVHVTMTGSYAGAKPALELTTVNGETRVTGGCPSGWFIFARCGVTLHIALPSDLPVTVRGDNGSITTDGLTGNLDFTTENGRIETTGTVGQIALRSTNGAIRVHGSSSTNVLADTTNGGVFLELTASPTNAKASSTNGAIHIVVPNNGTAYAITTDTTNGSINSDAVASDPSSRRAISARTTNGSVTIEPSGR
jgi:Putative adhesin